MNLFICLTPLQALIARQLIQTGNQNADLLMICYADADNAKYRHYFQQTAALCRRADYVLIPASPWARITALPRLLAKLEHSYHTIYAASIDNPNVQYPLSRLSFQRLETFDDGTANLYPDSILYRNQPTNPARSLLKTLQGIRYRTEDLRSLSSCHHTLYPNQPNIAAPTMPLQLWPDRSPLPPTQTQQRILLGQPLFPNDADNIALTEQLLQHFGISHYFPHPRERYRVQAAYIDTALIFEDWLLQNISTHPTRCFEIYHLASTAAINTAAFPHTQTHTIRPEHPFFRQPTFNHLYNLVQNIGLSITSLPITEEMIAIP